MTDFVETTLWSFVLIFMLGMSLMGCSSTVQVSYQDRNEVFHVDCKIDNTIYVGAKRLDMASGEEVLAVIEKLVGDHPSLKNQGHRDTCARQLQEAGMDSVLYLILMLGLLLAWVRQTYGRKVKWVKVPVLKAEVTPVLLFVGVFLLGLSLQDPGLEQAMYEESQDTGVMLDAPADTTRVPAPAPAPAPAPVKVTLAPVADPSMPWIRVKVRALIEGTSWTEGDVLWMARAAYSESARRFDMDEVRRIMEVIKNRVESSYQDDFVLPGPGVVYRVVLDPYQFSYFNDPDDPYGYRRMAWSDSRAHWLSFLRLAAEVLTTRQQVLPRDTHHFISPETMKALGEPMPKWTKEGRVVETTEDFTFYAGVR